MKKYYIMCYEEGERCAPDAAPIDEVEIPIEVINLISYNRQEHLDILLSDLLYKIDPDFEGQDNDLLEQYRHKE